MGAKGKKVTGSSISPRTVRGIRAKETSAKFVPRSLFALMALAIFFSEALVMFLLQWTPEMNMATEALVDAVLVTIFTFPLLYFLFYKPLLRHTRNLEKAEKELELFAVFVEQAEEVIVITDKKGTIEYVNAAFETITGYSFEEAVGKNPRLLKSGVHDAVFYEDMWQTLLAGHIWKGHIINRKKDGSLFEEKATISPLFDEHGNISHLVGIKRDMTSELSLERQIRQAQKMEAIGVMAGGIAHDFNNILSAIIGYTEMALDEIPTGNPVWQDLQEVLKGGSRAKDLVRQILTFSRQSESEFKPIELHTVIRDCLKLLRASLPATIEIVDDVDNNAGLIMGDATQMSQIIMNLGANAGHAMEDGGVLTVSYKKVDIDEAFARAHGSLKAGPHVRLTVFDSGHGMSKETIDRIFEPFFTTKEIGKGTGLGLAAVHGIILSHDGAISVSSEPGMGAAFDIYFPRITTKYRIAKEPVQPVSKGNERILLIDDEEAIVKVMTRGLNKLGYDVKGYVNSVEAVALFESDPDSFDLLITDLAMPNMSGEKVIARVHEIKPSLPIILITGYSHDISLEKIGKLKINQQIIKPLSAKDLANSVRTVLNTAIITSK